MRLVTYNIQYSRGRDGRFDLRRVVDALAGADVIALQEVERHWPRTGNADQPAEIAALLPGHHWVYGPSFDIDDSGRRADGSVDNRRRQFGGMLLSRAPILTSRLHMLPTVAATSHYNMRCGALEGVIETAAGPVRIYSIHLGYLSSHERVEQVETLLALHRRAAAEGGAWSGPGDVDGEDWAQGAPAVASPADAILLGDFNFEPDGPEYPMLAGPDDALLGRVAYLDRFVNAWAAAGKDEADCVTYPAAKGDPDLCLDYCFVTPALAPRVRDCWVDMAADGSDHQPVWTDIDL